MPFPRSPSDGQLYTSESGVPYIYTLANDKWNKVNTTPTPSSYKNKIVNGEMIHDQRNAGSLVNVNGAAYTLDRWQVIEVTDGSVDCQRLSNVPENQGFLNSVHLSPQVADVTMDAGQFMLLQQTIEGYNIRDLSTGNMTLSFWVNSSVTGTYCVAFRSSLADRSYVSEYVINSVDTWEKKSITVDLSAGVGSGTWDYVNGVGLIFSFCLGTSVTYQTTADTWVSLNRLGTSNQVNWMNSTSNNFYVTGVQLEAGDDATDYERLEYSRELERIYRYYYKSTQWGGGLTRDNTNTVNYHTPYHFKNMMRAAPTITYTQSGALLRFSGTGLTVVTDTKGTLLYQAANSTGAGSYFYGDMTLDAEL